MKEILGGEYMKILKNEKGQGMISGIMMTVIGLVLLAGMLPVIGELVGTIAAGNMANFSNVATIQLLLGMVGIIVVVMVIWGIVESFKGPGQQMGM
jgi:uncharacterized protein (DUF697 family)